MRVRLFYDNPGSRVVDIPDPPEDLEEEELTSWIFDNAPIVSANPWTWDYE